MKDISQKSIVCLGGGIGAANLIRGLSHYTKNTTVVVSMADDGGSAGRLRRLYKIMPPGDLVACMASFCEQSNPLLSKLLVYRFPGNRYAKDKEISGQKMGNLLVAALTNITGDFQSAIQTFQEIFSIPGSFFPATAEPVRISAKTIEGKMVYGEQKIDMGKYTGKRILERVYLYPKAAKASKGALLAIKQADVILCGPGDLYTAVLPVLIVPEIKNALLESRARKIFIMNIANKPFETRGYTVGDFLTAIKKHIGSIPFDTLLLNNTFHLPIPAAYKYSFVKENAHLLPKDMRVIKADLINESFALYHDSTKLAKALVEEL